MNKKKKIKVAVIATLCSLLVLFASLTVYAYFSTQVYVYTNDGNKEVFHTGMQLQLLFDRLNVESDVKDNQGNVTEPGADLKISYYYNDASGNLVYSDTTTATFDSSAPWGSAKNPYVISETRHLQNLAALQNVGYFDLMYLNSNFEGGNYTEGLANIPYFVVCKPDGTPTVVGGVEVDANDATKYTSTASPIEIKPIGSATHPFVGVIGGAFTEDTTTVDGKTSTVSAIHNVTVQTNTDQTDVGLFGYVGYLGEEPANPTVGTTFQGAVSVVKDLLISDVTVKVNNPTIAEIVSEIFGHVFNNHKYTYTGDTSNTNTVSHEDHHIGIFAGHVSYAHVTNISVYYSNQNMCAIDLKHTDANYHSSTGIVGFMHNMNSTITNQTSAHCLISYGGISSSGVNMTPDTPGAGGGDMIGTGRGYVVAKTLYEGCHYIQENQGMFERIWYFTVDGSKSYYGPMYYATTNGYTTQNGEAVTITDGTAIETKSGKTYTTYAIRTGTSSDNYVYTFYNDGDYKDGYEFKPNSNPNKKDDDKKVVPLNLEVPQSIWQYVITKPVDDNGNPIEDQGSWKWDEAVLVHQEDDKYYLKDDLFGNKFEVTVSGTTATIKGTSVTIQKFFFKSSDGTYYCLNADGQAVTPEFFREKPLLIANAQYMTGVDLCIDAEESNGKYFYDGVFTFALSDAMDAIESTWENETPDKIVLGPNSDNGWNANLKDGFYGVVAYIKPVTSKDAFDELAANGTPIFVGYPTGTGDNQQLHLLTLLEINPNSNSWDLLSDNFYSAVSYAKPFYTDEERDELLSAMSDYMAGINDSNMKFDEMSSGQSLQTLYDGVKNEDIQVLNLQSATDLDRLKNYYKITPSYSSSGYQFTQQADSKTTYLSIIRSKWDKLGGNMNTHYSMYSGTQKPDSMPDPVVGWGTYNFEWNTYASVDYSNNAFKVSYKYDNTTKFLRYNTREDCFDGSDDSSNVYFYTIVAMSSVKTGQVVYEPASGAQEKNTDEYVLWPQAIMKNNGTYNGFDEIDKKTFKQTLINNTNATATVTNGDVYNTYRLMSLNDLYLGDNGWQDGRANPLSNMNLRKKFAMQEAVQFNISLNLPIIGNIQANDNSVIAPVGMNGALANIPTGSIAFRINETTEEGNSIYVIASVPVSNFYDGGSEESLTTQYDYYLGLWQTQDIEDGQTGSNQFSQTTAVQKFELPRSRPYDPESTTSKTDTNNYILVDYGGTTYRCYLNGERVLVAYRFTVFEAGTYILGTAIGESSWTESTNYSYPMEIVYCAADGTASEGNDGTVGSVTGSLDYVYDYNNKIINVQDYDAGEGPSSSTPDYNYYYHSHIITYTDNSTTPINNLKIYPYRYIDGGVSKLSILVSDPALFKGKHAGVDTDVLIEGTPPSSGG